MRQDPPSDQGLEHNKHLWIHGSSGSGKTSVVEYLFPGHFRKRSDKDWLGWDENWKPHKVVHLNDFDMQAMKSLGVQHLKELCDPQGFNADVKYAGGKIINPSLVIVTSQFSIDECFAPGIIGIEQQKAALYRRFRQVPISEYLRENNILLCPNEEVQFAKDTGLWNAFGYQCMFKPIEAKDLHQYEWLKKALPEVIDLTGDSTDEDDFLDNNTEVSSEVFYSQVKQE